MLRWSHALFASAGGGKFGVTATAMKRANLSLHVDSSMQVADAFVPPARFSVAPWRDAKKRWFNFSQSYLWANRIALALRDQARVARGQPPKRIMNASRKLAMTFQLLLPRLSGFWKHRFARSDAQQLYLRLLDAHTRGDAAALKTLAADSFARKLGSELKARPPLPPGVALEFAGVVQSARAVNVRCVINPRPFVEFAQVLVLFRITQTVSVLHTPPLAASASPTATPPKPVVLSRQVRDVEEVIAFERNLIDPKGTWLVLDRVRSTVLSDRNETDRTN
jgi:hypothetical protein